MTQRRTPLPMALVVVLLLPLLVAGVGLWGLKDRAEALDRVPAAVVNLDKGAEITVDGKKQKVPFGRLLSGALTHPETMKESSTDTAGFDWQLTTREDAMSGLKNGTYSAVVVIPKDFSSHLATMGTKKASRAKVEVTTNDASGLLDSAIGNAIAQAVTQKFNSSMTEQYLDGIYVGFNDLHKGYQDAADGASSLAEGAGDLDTGATDLAEGTDQLSGGATELAGGTHELARGTGDLSDGAADLADGTTGLASGTRELSGGANQLAGGADDLAAGTGELADGARQLSSGTNALADGLYALDSGMPQLTGGATRLSSGAYTLAGGTRSLSDGAAELSGGLGDLAVGADRVATGIERVDVGLNGSGKTPACDTESANLPTALEETALQKTRDSKRELNNSPTASPTRPRGSTSSRRGSAKNSSIKSAPEPPSFMMASQNSATAPTP